MKPGAAGLLITSFSNPYPTPQALDLDFLFEQATNVLGYVDVFAQCEAAAYPVIKSGIISDSGQGTCQASADPVIVIDPTFLDDNPGVTLELSANVQQSPRSSGPPSVPEPQSLWMLLAGAGIVARARWGTGPTV
jgi:hypothetical protein